jgi:hypothetical protein
VSRSSAMGGRSWRHALNRMTGEAHKAAQSSAVGFCVQRAIEIPINANAEVMASLKWCQASPRTAVLSMFLATAET